MLGWLVSILLVGTTFAESRVEPAPLPLAEARIIVGENDADWKKLAAALADHGNITASFVENRYLPFKKIPVVFQGEMRLSLSRGLSLHYTAPQDQLMVVDEQGILLRDRRGRQREMPADPRAQAATRVLWQVLRFDLPALAQDFDLYGRRDGEQWQLIFEPRPGEIGTMLQRLTVSGAGTRVQKLEMRKSALQSLEILIGDTRTRVEFTPEELRSFFR